MPPTKKQSATLSPGNGNRRATAHNAEITDKERQALELRKAGASFDQIAERLGYSDRSGAHRAVSRALQSVLKEPAEELRALEAERLDRLLLAFWNDALDGDVKAADRVLRIMDQRAKLQGLNMPTKIDVDSTVTVDPADIEIVRRIREWRAARDG